MLTVLLAGVLAAGWGCGAATPGASAGASGGKGDDESVVPGTDADTAADTGALEQVFDCRPDGLGIHPDDLSVDGIAADVGQIAADGAASLTPLQRAQLWVAVNRVEDVEGKNQSIEAPADDETFAKVVFPTNGEAPRAVQLRHVVSDVYGPVDWVSFRSPLDGGLHSVFFLAGTLLMTSWFHPDLGEPASCSLACPLLPPSDCELAYGCSPVPELGGCEVAPWVHEEFDRAACLALTDEELCGFFPDCRWSEGTCMRR